MSWDSVFALTNVIALGGWLLLAAGSRGPRTMALVLYAGVGLLCLAYTAAFVATFGGLADPVRLAGAAEPVLSDYSIAGLRALFMSDAGIVIGWTHYLAFDLFVGQWIAKDADHKGFSRPAQLPVLFLTLMAGPVGLLVWLVVRERRARKAA
ncbi:ABA4-like family protein [Sphingomonas mesophila]|uniref:ABA4-like family protein n=1 Tax=Sphingomonas mesophila TaxID=2303576 RepID=UPI000E571AC9|nr:ABA4-like family protein [Sphingomonas mesophila]